MRFNQMFQSFRTLAAITVATVVLCFLFAPRPDSATDIISPQQLREGIGRSTDLLTRANSTQNNPDRRRVAAELTRRPSLSRPPARWQSPKTSRTAKPPQRGFNNSTGTPISTNGGSQVFQVSQIVDGSYEELPPPNGSSERLPPARPLEDIFELPEFEDILDSDTDTQTDANEFRVPDRKKRPRDSRRFDRQKTLAEDIADASDYIADQSGDQIEFTATPIEPIDQFIQKIGQQKITNAPSMIQWSLDDAINAALLYSYEIESLRLQTLENYQEVGIETGAFDAVAFFNANYNDSSQPVGTSFEAADTISRIRGEEFTTSYGIRKPLINGGEIEISEGFGTLDNTSGVLVPPDQANSQLTLRFTKELLQGSGVSIATNQVTVALLNANAQRFNSTAQIADLIQSVSNSYWDIFEARGSLLAAISSAEAAESTLNDLLARQTIDADPNLVEQARVVLEQQKVLADNAYAALANAQFNFVSLVNAPELLSNWQRIEIIPVVDPYQQAGHPDIQSRQNTALNSRPEVREVLENIKSSQLEYHFSINQLLPRLQFTSEAVFNGLAGERDLSAAAEDRFDADATYQLGFDFEIPLANRQARFRKRQIELALARLQREWQLAMETVKRDVLEAGQQYANGQSLVQRQTRIHDASVKRLEFLQLRQFSIPREGAIPSLQLGQLLDVQASVAQAKADYAAALATRGRSLVDLNRASGILVQPAEGGVDHPGTQRFVNIFHQYIEQETGLGDFARNTTRQTQQVSTRSPKLLGTWTYPAQRVVDPNPWSDYRPDVDGQLNHTFPHSATPQIQYQSATPQIQYQSPTIQQTPHQNFRY